MQQEENLETKSIRLAEIALEIARIRCEIATYQYESASDTAIQAKEREEIAYAPCGRDSLIARQALDHALALALARTSRLANQKRHQAERAVYDAQQMLEITK